MKTGKQIINSINIQKSNRGKSKMTSGNKYEITLSRSKKELDKNNSLYNGNVRFMFHSNYLDEKDKTRIIYSLLLDAEDYEECNSVDTFITAFGYNCYEEAERVFNACKKQHEKLYKLFTEEEIETLKEYFSEY